MKKDYEWAKTILGGLQWTVHENKPVRVELKFMGTLYLNNLPTDLQSICNIWTSYYVEIQQPFSDITSLLLRFG